MNIIGVDCAVAETNRGVAFGCIENDSIDIFDAAIGGKNAGIVEMISKYLLNEERTLLAFDAPLGWPMAMGIELYKHQAGDRVESPMNAFFSRATDRFVRDKIGQKPLEVGANLIARTAHSALSLLHILRKNMAIPLAWDAENLEQASVIEVYPAATLRAWRIDVPGYKKGNAYKAREKLIESLSDIGMKFSSESRKSSVADANALDATLCILAATDFIRHQCYSPPDPETAFKEGWIWVKKS